MDALLCSFVFAARLGFVWLGSALGSPGKRCWGGHRGAGAALPSHLLLLGQRNPKS